MDVAEREIWCKASRLLLQHGDQTPRYLETEAARLEREGDTESVQQWRQIAAAVQHLAD